MGDKLPFDCITQAGDDKGLIYSNGYENNERMAKLELIL